MKHLHTKNFKTLMKEIEEDANKQKDILCSRITRINIKMSKVLYRFSSVSIKIPMAFVTEKEKNNPKIWVQLLMTLNGQSNLEVEQSWRHHAS